MHEEPRGATVLELYKLAVELADRLSARRAVANSFFLTLHAALVAAIGLTQPGHEADTVGVVLVSAAGLVLAAAWWLLLRSYRLLSGAKFAVIGRLEQELPARPLTDEWRLLSTPDQARGRWARYVELGLVERFVPLAFAAIYVAVIVRFA